MRHLVILACVALVVVSATPNQLLDKVIARTNEKISSAGWCSSKKMANQEAGIPIKDQAGKNMTGDVTVTNAYLHDICNVKRSRSATFNMASKTLTGTLKITDAVMKADITAKYAGGGEAPSDDASGTAEANYKNIFMDLTIKYDDSWNPVELTSFEARLGQHGQKTTGIETSKYFTIDDAVLKEGFDEMVLDTVNRNVKAQVRSAILSMA